MSHTSDYTSFLQDFAEDRAPGAFNRGDLLFHLNDQPLLNVHLLLLALLPARSLSSILRLSDKKRKDRQFNRVGIICRYVSYMAYTIFVFVVMVLALPYYVYVEQGFHTDVSTEFKVFLIIVNLQPPLAWVFGLLYFRKGFEDYDVKRVEIGKKYDERICERANEDGIGAHEWQRARTETRERERERENRKKRKEGEDSIQSESEPSTNPDEENAMVVQSDPTPSLTLAPEPSYHNTDPEEMEVSKKYDDIDSKQKEFFKKHETQSSKAHFRRVAVAMFDDPEIQLDDRTRLNKRTSLHLRLWMALSLLLNAIYVLWLWLNVYNGPSNFSDLQAWTKGIFIALPLTFWYRLSAPSTLCVFFSSLCGYHIEKMLIYERMHPRRKDRTPKPKPWEKIKFLTRKLTFNILNRESTEKAFQLPFVSIHIVPWVSVSYMVYLTWSDARELAEAWFFIPYAFLCLAEAFWIFWFAAEITESSIVVRNRIYKDIATKSIDFHDELKSVVGYLEWANQCYVGFKVLGIPISRSTAAQALQLFVVIVVPIITQRIIAVK
eukprot:TRINITY_DN1370_c0_g1_i6.p1 TRINITY_DN1370_c0_g1~~TRINITY_DN1370_c0_g1_i6.p1  ORF type:complete len:550 (+),score=93.92 TRINITY_DN1370_c0_g1_i6:31-1680(+)